MSFQSIAAVRIPAKALSRILRHSALGIIWDRFGVRVGHPCRLNSISLGISHKCFTATATRRGAGDLLLFIFAALPRGYFGNHCMSWHSFFNAWQRIDIEEDVSSLIQSAFTRGPEVARRGSSDFRRRLTASLKAFRTLRTCLLATSAPDSAVQLCNIRLREIKGGIRLIYRLRLCWKRLSRRSEPCTTILLLPVPRLLVRVWVLGL